jgi:hypothetical protein
MVGIERNTPRVRLATRLDGDPIEESEVRESNMVSLEV